MFRGGKLKAGNSNSPVGEWFRNQWVGRLPGCDLGVDKVASTTSPRCYCGRNSPNQ